MKTFFFLFFFLALLALLCVAALPSFLSTDWGKKELVQWVNRSIPGELELNSLSLDWQKNQIAEGIVLKDPQGKTVLTIKKLKIDAPLWELMRKSTHLGLSSFQELNATIEVDEHGITNLEKAIKIESDPNTFSLPLVIDLKGTDGTFNFANKQDLSVHLDGKAIQNNEDGTFAIDLFLPGLASSSWQELKQDIIKYFSLEGSQKANFYAKMNNFPTGLIDRFLNTESPVFHSFVGDHFDLILEKKPSFESVDFDLKISSPLVQGNFNGKLLKGALSLNSPAIFEFNLVPELINPLLQSHLQLMKKAQLKIALQEIVLPLSFFDKQHEVSKCELMLTSQAEFGTMHLNTSTLGEFFLTALKIGTESSFCDSLIRINADGKGIKEGKSFTINMESFVDKPSSFQKFSLENILYALNIDSPLGFLSTEGALSQGILTLKKPLELKIPFSHELKEVLIQNKIPILKAAVQGENPISLIIDPQGFSCPIIPFNADTIQIQKGSVNLGKLQFKNEGELSTILNLISPIHEDQFMLWFTPIYFQMNRGTIQLKRFDFLVANLYQLASWGQIDVKNQQSALVLGVTSQALNYAFGIKDLKDEYILQIPLREKNGKMEIDKKQAAGRISALLAQMHGNSKTKLLGDVLELAQPATSESPLPTTSPFPWSNALKNEKSESSAGEVEEGQDEPTTKESKKKRKKNQQTLFEGLEKEAAGLLKKWIK
ncbi:MAG: hypothetical protein H0V82_01855 [Candidatus Protochlamydia sp.]|nr:hypothetical protein [Candidatus Protochlamydia sp.]